MTSAHRKEYKIVFEPDKRSVYALSGTTLFEVAARAGLMLKTPCGGNGTCGKCRVRVLKGDCPPSSACRELLSTAEIAHGVRLACQAEITESCVVEIPEEALFESSARILVAAEKKELTINPCLNKVYLTLPSSVQTNGDADVTRLEKALDRSLYVPLPVLRQLPIVMRKYQFQGTAVTYGNRLLAFEPGDTTSKCYGIAFDLGTTTVVGSLMNLREGKEIAVSAAMNPQIRNGDDVISRILKVRNEEESLPEMHHEIVREMNRIINDLTAQAGIKPEDVYEIAVAGNTAMQHILCNISPAVLGEIPFPAVNQKGILCRSTDCGLKIHPQAPLYVFPHIGGFVGGDTVAGIMAALMHTGRKNRILVDIGTNGEIVLATDGRLLAASAAAGPAFEGARITNGMRAAKGAIEKIVANDNDIEYNVIGNIRPLGICGSALIDLVAELLRRHIIDSSGRILPPEEIDHEIPGTIRKRLLVDEDGRVNFLVVNREESGNGKPIILYQKDVRELQLATGAIRAGINILRRKSGKKMDEIDEIMLAGAFGNFIRRDNARRIGLLPRIPSQKIKFIGNASSMGAKLVLLSSEIRQLAEKMAAHAEHIELSTDPEFQTEFADAMIFPEE